MKHWNATHQMSHTPEHNAWSGMRRRCYERQNPAYPTYGGRGITVCERWMSFELFFEDMGLKPSPAHSLERINNDLGYSPENCKWGTRKEQSNNRGSFNRRVEFDGRTQTVGQWADEFGLKIDTLARRINVGWPINVALTEPLRPGRKLNANNL